MRIQVNSDNTIAVDAGLTQFVEAEVSRILGRFAIRLTRAEIHLSDIDNRKTGKADKRCLIEVRPIKASPLTASAKATKLSSAVVEALGKMQRSLTTLFGRRGRQALVVATAPSSSSETAPGKIGGGAKKSATARKQIKLSPRGPKKRGIYQARRKSWPAR